MLTYKGGQEVTRGTYWNLANGFRVDMGEKGPLPESRGTTYLKMAPGIMVVLGPFIGMLYVVFLPIMTIGTVIVLAVKRIVVALSSLVSNIAYFEWRPTESYLTGEKKRKKKETSQKKETGRKK